MSHDSESDSSIHYYRSERVGRRRADNGGAGADSEGADADELDIKLGEAEERVNENDIDALQSQSGR